MSQAPFLRSMDSSQRASVFTPEGMPSLKIETKMKVPKNQNYVSVRNSMRGTPQSGLHDIDAILKQNLVSSIQ